MIVNQLIQIQQRENLTDDQFAKSLGIHRVSWLRNKRTNLLSSDTLLKAFEVYPELREKFLSSFAKVGNHNATAITTDGSEASQDGKLGRFRGWLRGFINRTKELLNNSREL